ncbi:hypothetical protein [Plantibacter sp. RU18]|uniref:hypothetical protein n=1 Tax=Plantibacter sp. RU18 TaxID=3158143 RepID=UPI003D35F882
MLDLFSRASARSVGNESNDTVLSFTTSGLKEFRRFRVITTRCCEATAGHMTSTEIVRRTAAALLREVRRFAAPLALKIRSVLGERPG